jgi:4a-hydroxytetrahydrobiopterin dehydratase
VELLDTTNIAKALEGKNWAIHGTELVKVVRRNDFDAAVEFVNQVAVIANRSGHHPDIDIRWNVVTLRLSTHSLGGVSDADLALADALDAIS